MNEDKRLQLKTGFDPNLFSICVYLRSSAVNLRRMNPGFISRKEFKDVAKMGLLCILVTIQVENRQWT
jgi:hypothetical protein